KDSTRRVAQSIIATRYKNPCCIRSSGFRSLEFLCRLRPRSIIEAAARNPEQRALPAYGQPRFRRDHRPPLSNREMAGCPARKSHSTCSWPIFRCRSSITFCASSAPGALLPRANSSVARFTSSGFLLTALSNTAIACAFIGGTARPGGLGFAPNGREPRLLMPRQSWRAVVMPHLLEAGRGDVIAPSIQIEEASVAIVGKALL